MYMYVDPVLDESFNVRKLANLINIAQSCTGKQLSDREKNLLYRFSDMLSQIPFENYNMEVIRGNIIRIRQPEDKPNPVRNNEDNHRRRNMIDCKRNELKRFKCK